MANLSYTATANLSVTGITPATATPPLPTSTLKINAQYTGTTSPADDRLDEVYTINASTPDTALNLGKIVSGEALWIQVDGPLHVTLTQDLGSGPVQNVIRVEDFLMLSSSYTAISVANPSATAPVHLSVIVLGNRAAVGGGPGVF